MNALGSAHEPARVDAGAVPDVAVAWHALGPDDVMAELGTRTAGLRPEEARARLAAGGENVLPEAPPTSRLATLLHQVESPLIYILVIACAVTLAIGEYVDASVIAVVVILNTAIGYAQERRAEGSVRALARLLAPHARVVRGGREWQIESRELVAGDIVLLDSGARVPADLRLVAASALAVDESLLTGESLPVRKNPSPVDPDAPLADRTSMAYTGTVVASGRARGCVVATGTRTELGAIAGEIRRERPVATPLQVRMDRFARVIGIAVAAGAFGAFGLGLALGHAASDMFMLAVAVAVSVVPESLPVILTITLAVGVRRMARRSAILRRLPAVETLGSTTVIGSDKTGTLTENQMTVVELWAGGRTVALGSQPPTAHREADRALERVLLAGVLANEAEVYDTPQGRQTRGDPTEVALIVAANQLGLDHARARENRPVRAEIPFEPERQYAASIRDHAGHDATFVKGAPERVLAMCATMLADDRERPLDRERVLAAARAMAARGLRVLAMADADTPRASREPGEVREPSALCLVGLAGMMDPPRAGVPEAIFGCQQAGIRVVMITGDHAETARAIGEQIGIAPAGAAAVIGGRELDAMSDAELRARLEEVRVFARVTPAAKLRIVRALQARGEVVAVTGDGVNDAPALKAAELGVAMGKSGTDVAREAADMVLADDNFTSIFAAVEEGRIVFDNIRKVTFFLISTGVAELVTILVSLGAGWAIPFLPAQLLWLNLVTNGLLDLALAFEPGEPGVLAQPPRSRREGIISPRLWERTVLAGIVMASGTLVMFHRALDASGSLAHAQTVALTTMVFFQMFHVGNCRSERLSLLAKSPFSNLFLFLSAAGSFAVHVGALYVGPTQFVLRVEPIVAWQTWVEMMAVASSILVAIELHKRFRSQPARSHDAARTRRPASVAGSP